MAIEEPKYDIVLSQAPYELRHYASTLIAETLVEGNLNTASNKGFRLLANFIFGNNNIAGGELFSQIAMTAPVTVEPRSSNIAMTAPVTIEPQLAASTGTSIEEVNQWRIHFVMPSQYTLDTIPRPNHSAVTLRQIPRKHVVVLRYSGFNTLSRVQQKTNKAIAWAKEQSLTVIGTPQLARYDPPWTLPMFRRNEIMLEVDTPEVETESQTE